MGMITVKDRQTLLDITLQTSGSVEAVMELAKQNGLSITDELSDGQVLEAVEVKDATVVERYAVEGVCPATEEEKWEIKN